MCPVTGALPLMNVSPHALGVDRASLASSDCQGHATEYLEGEMAKLLEQPYFASAVRLDVQRENVKLETAHFSAAHPS